MADAAVVSRRPGVGKESGLVTDAVQFGVPLLLSDHDPALTACLAGQDWVRLFPAGDPAGLAAALTDLVGARLPRPSIREDVQRRAANSVNNNWETKSPARLAEARRLLHHLRAHGGRIDVDEPLFGFRPVTPLRAVPEWWAQEATRLVDRWRPPHAVVAG